MLLAAVAVVQACSSSPPPVLGSGNTQSPVPLDGATSAPGQDGASPTGVDSGLGTDATTGGDGASPAEDAGPDVGPYIDARLLDHTGGSPTCNSEWWATNSAFDATVTPASFSSALNPIVGSSSIHPFTLVVQLDDDSGAWTGTASGTTTNGGGDQYFPATNAATPTTMIVTSTSVATAAPEVTAWFHVHDAGGNDIWIPIGNVGLSATYGDESCDTLVSGTLTAVILASASSQTIQPIGQSPTTMGALLGTQTSTSPAGWNVQMAFDATSVQVD